MSKSDPSPQTERHHAKALATANRIKPHLLNEYEAARFLGFSVFTLRLGRYEGHRGNRTPMPKHIKLGKSVRYSIDDLNAWIEERRKEIEGGGKVSA